MVMTDMKVNENELNDYFKSLASKDGKLDVSTFKHVLRQVGLNPDEGIILETVEEIQKDGSIFADQLKEFLSTVEEKHQNLKKVFDWIDADKNGYLDRYEIKMAFAMSNKPFTEEDVEKLMLEADTDKDGRISFLEFRSSRVSNLFSDV